MYNFRFKKSSGEIIGWTHADMQTDPADALTGLEFSTHQIMRKYL